MFDMGITELMLIAVVALVVIGPEKLPSVARTAGKYVGRLKRFMSNVKADVESELRADELRDILKEQQQELNSLKQAVSDAGKEFEESTKLDDSKDDDSNRADAVSEKDWTQSIQPPSTDKPLADKQAASKKKTSKKAAVKKAAVKKTSPKKAVPKKSKVTKKTKIKTSKTDS